MCSGFHVDKWVGRWLIASGLMCFLKLSWDGVYLSKRSKIVMLKNNFI